MKSTYALFLFFILICPLVSGQQKEVTLEEIWNGTFRQEMMQSLQSLKNGEDYVVLNFDRQESISSVDVYSYKTGEKTGTLVSSTEIPEVGTFRDFELSEDESRILLATQIEPIYRRSSRGIYYVYDVRTGGVEIVRNEKVQEPAISPDGEKVAYVFENNIYVKDLGSGEITQVTRDGEKNKIINGITDWVYEEEFTFVQAYKWNGSGEKIAFLRFDESEVPEFSMDIYGDELYPKETTFKYPKAGEENSDVSLHIYDLSTRETTDVGLPDYEYIPRLKWTKEPDLLSIQTLNRHQNNLNLYFVNADTGNAELILNETDEAYVDVSFDLTFLEDNKFIWTSEKDGWNHIYLYDSEGELINQITEGNWVVTSYYGYDPDKDRIFYQSTENGSINRDVYSIKVNGNSKSRLTEKTGQNSADFSADYTYFINSFNSATSPFVYTLHLSRNGKLIREIKDNEELLEKIAAYDFSPKEFSTIQVNGNDLNMWMIKPSDFDPDKQYPLFMFQYSGPGSQSVSNTFFNTNDYWYQLLADEGYIIAAVDGRGTGFKGAEFKKMTQNELGKYELEDQIAAAQLLGSRNYIDKDRIGIWGWSYGGFMASNAILQGSEIFAMAIAVAPVTSWRFYDTVYTERFMSTPQENPSGYDENSPINHVEKLEDPYLLVHGTGDDNVHVQNTMRMIEALVQAGKQFRWALYPDRTHGIFGGNTRLHLYTMMTNFIRENL